MSLSIPISQICFKNFYIFLVWLRILNVNKLLKHSAIPNAVFMIKKVQCKTNRDRSVTRRCDFNFIRVVKHSSFCERFVSYAIFFGVVLKSLCSRHFALCIACFLISRSTLSRNTRKFSTLLMLVYLI